MQSWIPLWQQVARAAPPIRFKKSDELANTSLVAARLGITWSPESLLETPARLMHCIRWALPSIAHYIDWHGVDQSVASVISISRTLECRSKTCKQCRRFVSKRLWGYKIPCLCSMRSNKRWCAGWLAVWMSQSPKLTFIKQGADHTTAMGDVQECYSSIFLTK